MSLEPGTGRSARWTADPGATGSYAVDRLRELLLFGMMDGNFGPDHKFDDRVLGREFNASRAVVRDALGALADSGVVTRSPRSGTRSSHQPSIFETSGMTMSAPGRAGQKHWRTGAVRDVPAPPFVARDLEVEVGDTVTLIERMTMLGDRVSSVWTIWTALRLPQEWRETGLPPHLNWYATAAVVTGQTDFTVDRVSTVYRAVADDAERLDLELGDPVLFNARLTRTMSGRPVDRSFGRWGATHMLTYDRTTVHVSDS